MLFVLHNNNNITQVLDESQQNVSNAVIDQSIARGLYNLAQTNPEKLLIWCFEADFHLLNIDVLSDVFHHNRIFASFQLPSQEYLPKSIGYVDRTCFVAVNKTVSYPTWMASALVGGVHAAVLLKMCPVLNLNHEFNYFLNSLAKLGMVQGLFCYSEPRLLLNTESVVYSSKRASKYTLFKFVKQHYKWVWVYFLVLSYWIYEKKIMISPLFYVIFIKQVKINFQLDAIKVQSRKKILLEGSIDVIIPTIGRKKFLHDVLKDLAMQTALPKNVIIVEQNPDLNSKSDLDYITNETWPFVIKHTFTHHLGACQARNIALSQVTSEWTLLGDDDNRFDVNLLSDFIRIISQYGVEVVSSLYLQSLEKQNYFITAQTGIFGSGNSMIKSSLINKTKFDTRYEFNYGEDSDFGMQLRHQGVDVIFCTDIKITHLKAPMGGFRTKMTQLWDEELIQPKPSPTIQLYHQRYSTKNQILGYKLLLGIKFYREQTIKNPLCYLKEFKKRWTVSEQWASVLNKK